MKILKKDWHDLLILYSYEYKIIIRNNSQIGGVEMSNSMMSDVPEVNFIIVFLIFIIGVASYGIYYDHVNKFYVNRSFMRCSYSDIVKVGNNYNFECQEFDVIPLGRKEVNKKDEESFKKVNDHCITFGNNGNCKEVITNYTAKEVKEILSRKKILKSDVLGYLK